MELPLSLLHFVFPLQKGQELNVPQTKAAGAAGHTWADAQVSGQLASLHSHSPKSVGTGSSSVGQVSGAQAKGMHGIFFWFNVLKRGI